MIMTTTDIAMIIVATLCAAGATVCIIKLIDIVAELIDALFDEKRDD